MGGKKEVVRHGETEAQLGEDIPHCNSVKVCAQLKKELPFLIRPGHMRFLPAKHLPTARSVLTNHRRMNYKAGGGENQTSSTTPSLQHPFSLVCAPPPRSCKGPSNFHLTAISSSPTLLLPSAVPQEQCYQRLSPNLPVETPEEFGRASAVM